MIRNSYIFDNTVIGPNCVIDQSIIGANVNVREGTTIEKGCLVADGVAVGPKAVLQAFDRVSRKKENTSIPQKLCQNHQLKTDKHKKRWDDHFCPIY